MDYGQSNELIKSVGRIQSELNTDMLKLHNDNTELRKDINIINNNLFNISQKLAKSLDDINVALSRIAEVLKNK
jgi:cob(I)alamin adenosyltransferase